MLYSERLPQPSGGVAQHLAFKSKCGDDLQWQLRFIGGPVQYVEKRYYRYAVLLVHMHQCLGSRRTEGAHLRPRAY
jgi:hypothetical protein